VGRTMKRVLAAISPRVWPVWRRRPARLLVAAAIVLIACSLILDLVEWGLNPNVTTVWSGFTWTLRTLLEQSSPWPLMTAAGNVVYFVVLLVGVALVAMATGLIASKVISVVMRKERGMGNARRRQGHIIICGWSKKGEEIIRELHADDVVDKHHVVILADLETAPLSSEHVTFVRGSATQSDDLERAGVTRSSASIILADRSNPACTVDEIDAKTLLSVLAVESVCPKCYTCVEVISSRNRVHFERTNADEIIVSAELTGSLLASSAMNHGVGRVVADLITTDGAEFCAIDAPSWLCGEDFGSAMTLLKRHHGCLPIALATDGHDFEVNPRFDTKIASGDRLLVIADRDPSEELTGGHRAEMLVAAAS
jgi:voltage-gated potassium channel